MEKKTYEEDADNKFEVDELGESASAKSASNRTSTHSKCRVLLHRVTLTKKKEDSEDEDSEDCKSKKKGAKVKTRPNKGGSKAKGEGIKHEDEEDNLNEEEVEDKDLVADEEVDEKKVEEKHVLVPEEVEIGDFVTLRKDFFKPDKDFAIHRLERKTITVLRKYIPYDKAEGLTYYKSTNKWTPFDKRSVDHFPISVVDHEPRSTSKVHVVEYKRLISIREDSPAPLE